MIGSLEELRRYLHTTGGGAAADDLLLGDLLAAASDRVVELAADRTLEPLPALRNAGTAEDPDWVDDGDPVAIDFVTRGRSVQVPDLRDVVTVTVDGVETTDYALRGRRGQPALWVRLGAAHFTPGVLVPATVGVGFYDQTDTDRTVTITGRWGPPGPGAAPRVKEAVLVWAARVYHERAARFSDARQDPEGGVASYFRAVPPSIKQTIDGLRVPGL